MFARFGEGLKAFGEMDFAQSSGARSVIQIIRQDRVYRRVIYFFERSIE